MRKVIIALLFVAACGGADKDTTTTPEPEAAGPTCDTAAAHAVSVIRADMGDKVTEDQYAQVSQVMTDSCNSGWSAEAIACVNDAADHEHLHECSHVLTEEQHAALKAKMEEILGGSMHHDAAE